MDEISQSVARRIPISIALAAGVTAAGGLVALVLLEKWMNAHSWVIYTGLVPVYILLQICVEGVLEGFWSAKRWVAKLFALALLVGAYALWFAIDG